MRRAKAPVGCVKITYEEKELEHLEFVQEATFIRIDNREDHHYVIVTIGKESWKILAAEVIVRGNPTEGQKVGLLQFEGKLRVTNLEASE